MSKWISFILFCLAFSTTGWAQQDSSLLSLLGEDKPSIPEYESAIFKTTRIINSHSIENVYKGVLELRISHRFGVVNRGLYDLFGLDQASMKINFDYGLTKRLAIGIGRSNIEKTFDGFAKYKLIKQTTSNKMPIGVVVVTGMSMSSLKWANPNRKNYFTSRLSFFTQVLIARKFNESFSLQIMPTILHKNLVADNTVEKNDQFFMGIGMRQKITKRTSINFEYFYSFNKPKNQKLYNSMSIGFDFETGGHVFQLHFTNSIAMHERGFLSETSESWFKGGIHFGFNLSRVFTVKSYY